MNSLATSAVKTFESRYDPRIAGVYMYRSDSTTTQKSDLWQTEEIDGGESPYYVEVPEGATLREFCGSISGLLKGDPVLYWAVVQRGGEILRGIPADFILDGAGALSLFYSLDGSAPPKGVVMEDGEEGVYEFPLER